MNDTPDDRANSGARMEPENVQISVAQVTQMEDGSLREVGDGEQYSDVYWDDAVSTTLHQTHPRIPELQTQVDCKYKFADGMLKVRTSQYRMTTRYGNWKRANIDLAVFGGHTQVRKNSPDEMQQDNRWHAYDIVVESALGPAFMGMWISIRVDYDGTNNDVGPNEGWGTDLYPAREPLIQSPASDTEVTMPFVVSGINGHQYGEIRVFALTSDGGKLLGKSSVGREGDWRVSVTLPPSILSFYALQRLPPAEESLLSNIVTIRDPYKAPLIDFPANDAVLATATGLLLKGRGTPDKVIDVMIPGGHILHATTTVRPDGTWEALFNANNYPNGGEVLMQAGHRDMNDWSAVRTFTLLSVLTITTPASETVTDPRSPISGGNGAPGAVVEVLKDLQHSFLVGRGTVDANGQWTVSTFIMPIPPGPFSIVARQTLRSVTSTVSAARSFKVRPPALTSVTVTHPTTTTVKFAGAGHTGATVEITGGPTGVTIPAVQVTDGRWEITSSNWPFGTYQLTATQKVSDNAGGWISSLPLVVNFSKTFPLVSDVQYTQEYRPTISGRGLERAIVNLFDPGGVSSAAPDTVVDSSGRWSSRASEVWGPTWRRPVHIRQNLNGQSSAYIELHVTIAPLAPTLNAPVENEMSPELSGTCWPGARVNVRFSDSATVHPVSSSGGNWTFRRPTPFAAGVTHTVTVTQTAAEQTSAAVTATFTVHAPTPQPIITVPANNAEVERELTVHGNQGLAGAKMQLRDAQFGRDLGAPKTLTSSGAWSINLSSLAFREYTIDAQQVINGRASPRSEYVMFKVVLSPPVIEVPAQDASLPRTSTLSGTGMPGGWVEIRLQGQTEPLLTNLLVGSDGRWRGDVTLPVGDKVLTARQTFETQTSSYSTPRTYSVVPAPPIMETPAVGEHVGRRLVVSGFGVPGDTVAVRVAGSGRVVHASSGVQADRTWSVTIEVAGPGGTFDVVAVASSEGFDSADSAGRSIELGTYMPTFQQPDPGRWVNGRIVFKGLGRPGTGRLVSWYNPDQLWTPAMPVTAAGWQGEATQALPAGGNWCRFVQVISDNADGANVSDWADSQRFEVLPESPVKR